MRKKKIVIIGAGLTGLTLNYLIQSNTELRNYFDLKIIEGRDRIGGRIFTQKKEDVEDRTIEMGATWFGSKHKRFQKILNNLGITSFEQKIGDKAHYEPLSTSPPYLVELPPNPEPSLRLQGGTYNIVKHLATYLPLGSLILNAIVTDIEDQGEELKIVTDSNTHSADFVISTLPPYLFQKTINVNPKLPKAVNDIMNATHTWMGDSIKIALGYKKAFWQQNDSSGTIFSNVGPIPEMYDHSNYENNFYALKGFFNGNYYSISKAERLQKTLNQLKKYFGEVVDDYTFYQECIWRNEPLTFFPYDSHVLPHQNNGHDIFHESYLGNKLFIGGTETAKEFPGYMEGAIGSAEIIYNKILSILK